MTLPRFVLALAVAIATLLACLAPRTVLPAPTIPARELLTLAQRESGANYTFDRATSEALATVTVPRPPEDATATALESALHDAGFTLRAVGPESKKVYLVERARS
jgi:hypothetical protein